MDLICGFAQVGFLAFIVFLVQSRVFSPPQHGRYVCQSRVVCVCVCEPTPGCCTAYKGFLEHTYIHTYIHV